MEKELYPYKPVFRWLELALSTGAAGLSLLVFIPVVSAPGSSNLPGWLMVLGILSLISFIHLLGAICKKFIKISISDAGIRYRRQEMAWLHIQSLTICSTTIMQNGIFHAFDRSLLFKTKNGESLKLPFYQRNLFGEITFQHDPEAFIRFLNVLEQKLGFKTGSLQSVYLKSSAMEREQKARYGLSFQDIIQVLFGRKKKRDSSQNTAIKSAPSQAEEFYFSIFINKSDSEQERIRTFDLLDLPAVRVKIPRGISGNEVLRLTKVGERKATVYLNLQIRMD